MRNLVRPTGSRDVEIEKMIDVLSEKYKQSLEDLVSKEFPHWPKATSSEPRKVSTLTIADDGSIQIHRLL
ncbi:hypothetical protein NP572_19460 [Pseudomonas putida]|uniref:hypothetical protein n=1 Tax=Pseudomonas putida TaxID=303 RepID=UPI002364A27D|nr:hypothetical protein [Pseudomonas putida]MDD2038759.1 hypothetical protein [Pseudomonas putida]MDD2044296.1 hypothetical protein [Pseudomonas putida]